MFRPRAAGARSGAGGSAPTVASGSSVLVGNSGKWRWWRGAAASGQWHTKDAVGGGRSGRRWLASVRSERGDTAGGGGGSAIGENLIRQMPKAELHRHLDGSVRLRTILELAAEQGVKLPATDEKGLRAAVAFEAAGDGAGTLERYLRGFDVSLSVLQKPYAITRVMYEVCEDAAADGVAYLEVRFSPILHVAENASLSQVMEAICEGRAMAERRLRGLVVRVLVCGMRQQPPEVTRRLAEIAWRYREKGVAGFDLAGPEHGFSSRVHREAFDLVRSRLLNCTLHSGEASGWRSVQDSIRFCGARRIGHGIALRESPALVRYCADHSVAVECCPTSNLHTGAVRSLDEHPLPALIRAGVPVVICTDNTTISGVTLSHELDVVMRHFGFDAERLLRLLDDGFAHGFLESARRTRLRADALRASWRVLRAHGLAPRLSLESQIHFARLGSGIFEENDDAERGDDAKSGTEPRRYWGGWRNPPLTTSVLHALPKADLHCRLEGSVPAEVLLQEAEISAMPEAERRHLAETLLPRAQAGDASSAAAAELRAVALRLLQTPAQLRRAVKAVLARARAENVCYLELQLRPTAHLERGMSSAAVLDTVLDELGTTEDVTDQHTAVTTAAAAAAHKDLTVRVVVYANEADDPLAVQSLAELAVSRRDRGVVGFGLHGELASSGALPYYRATLSYLKENDFNVVIFAREADSIVQALHLGGASRVSGAFAAHLSPGLMSYLALHGVPVELGLTAEFAVKTSDVASFVHPVRLLFDKQIPVALCSFRSAVGPSRVAALESLMHQCYFTVADVFHLLMTPFWHNFLPLPERQRLARRVWLDARALLESRGYRYLEKKFFFPEGE